MLNKEHLESTEKYTHERKQNSLIIPQPRDNHCYHLGEVLPYLSCAHANTNILSEIWADNYICFYCELSIILSGVRRDK